MAKSPKKLESKPPRFILDSDTQRAILGLISFTVGLVVILAFFELAGPAGKGARQLLFYFFGVGSFLVPLSFFLVAAIFFANHRSAFYLSTLFGVGILVLALLGIFDEFQSGRAGLLGAAVGSISMLFGFWAGLVILSAMALAGFLLTFQTVFLRRREKQVQFSKTIPQELMIPPQKLSVPPEAKPAFGEKEVPRSEAIPMPKSPKAGSWQFPPLSLLSLDSRRPAGGDIRLNSHIIQRTLENFGIPVEMGAVNVGPTVTQYTLKPAQGVKLSKIVTLQSDLALALASHPLRIEAPIPGQALVGIEVPNKSPSLVRLRNLLEEKSFRVAPPLTFPLGRDVMGQAVFADLGRMPHLLVAGATGSGKSIFIHSLILSLIFRNPPDELRLLLVDPKRVELSQYEGIPYLLSPVITEGKKSVLALRWAIEEMERRYDMLMAEQARDILSFNEKVTLRKDQTLPFIVVIIDELADLMAAFGREIEASIIRLSQMARATGIHLVVSTQRPSVEVITGLIKANITSRIAFQVASQVDSRTIIDSAGADKLLGSGDLLFLSADTSKPKRIQSAFVDENEVKRVVNFLRQAPEIGEVEEISQEADTLEKALEEEKGPDIFDEFSGKTDDELYREAYRVILQAKKASASLLQRRLKIGYARAARLLDILEARGIVGPAKGAKPRAVFIRGSEINLKEYHHD